MTKAERDLIIYNRIIFWEELKLHAFHSKLNIPDADLMFILDYEIPLPPESMIVDVTVH